MDPVLYGLITKLAKLLPALFKVVPACIQLIDNNKQISTIVNKAIDKAKKGAGVGDSWGIKRPFAPSNSVLINLIIRKANNESITNDIPHYFIGNEFDSFYEIITENKKFWEILKQLLQEHKLDIITGIISEEKALVEGISKKTESEQTLIEGILTSITNGIDTIIEEINKPRFPWLKSYSDFAFSAKERQRTFRDENTIATIEDMLNNDHICLIKACEGRGKTILCRIVAEDYHELGFNVHFIDLKNSNINEDDLSSVIKQLGGKSFLVMENIHACQFLEQLIGIIKDEENKDVFFLLNARPTEQEQDHYLSKLGKTVNFNPKIRYSANVARKLCSADRFIPYVELSSFIGKKIYTNQNGNGANLRLLKIYMDIWNDPDSHYSHIDEIDEESVLVEFQNKYKIKTLQNKEKRSLLLLGAIFQFDVPLPKSLLTDDELDSMVDNTIDGMVAKHDFKYYLPHSIDAYYLCKAICHYEGDDYHEATVKCAKKFISSIQHSINPEKYEREFALLTSGMVARRDMNGDYEFEDFLRSLYEWKSAKKIIQTINRGFMLQAFHTHWHTSAQTSNFYYKNKDKWLKCSMLKLSPPLLMKVCLLLIKYVDKNIVRDLFDDPNDLTSYLERFPLGFNKVFSNNRVKKLVLSISKEHKLIAKKHLKGASVEPVQYLYYFNTKPRNSEGFYVVSQQTIYKNWKPNNHFDIQELRFGFILENLNWNGLQRFIKIIQLHMDDTNQPLAIHIVRKIVQLVLRRDAFHHASAKDLSSFLRNVSLVDENLYNSLITSPKVITDVENRLAVESYGLDELWLFSHFYTQDWFGVSMTDLVRKTSAIFECSEEELSRKLNYFESINAKFLQDFTNNPDVIRNIKFRLDAFSFREDNLYLFAHFYSQDWCKTTMISLINKANQEQQELLKEWHDTVMLGLKKGKKAMNTGTLLAYINGQPFCQQLNN